VSTPPLPPGRELHISGRGTTFVRELPGPRPNAPAVMLLHGWTATADVNFFALYELLAEHFRVVAVDHRGHGRGIRSRRVFRLADCADDAAAVAAELGIDRFVPVGYSMGGTVAMLLWRRHAPAISGLVLCSTAASFSHHRAERLSFLGLTGLGAVARLTPEQTRQRVTEQVFLRRKAEIWQPWAVEQVARHDWRMVLEAGHALGTFSAHRWLGEIDVPTSVITTTRDKVVPTARQRRLAESIPGATAREIDGEHDAAVSKAAEYAGAIVESVHEVLGGRRRRHRLAG
jgi:3-oxoadipate enol-lactonase